MKIELVTLTLGLYLGINSIPGLTQDEISNNQPMSKRSSAQEVRIQAKLKLDFKKGLIDSSQLAELQRDFDAILVHEDELKMRSSSASSKDTIKVQLQAFEQRLDKAAGVKTTAQAANSTGVKANKNNSDLSDIAPTR